MARMNVGAARSAPTTHEGAQVRVPDALSQLRKSVSACLLWEDTFYEDGESIANRISTLACKVKMENVAQLAVEVRTKHGIRHASLFLAASLLKHPDRAQNPSLVGDTIGAVIQRADELGEMCVLVKGNAAKLKPMPRQLRRGLDKALRRFNAYQLAKYRRSGAVRLQDVLALTHPKPDSEDQAKLWEQVVRDTLPAPETWESKAMAGEHGVAQTAEDKRRVFEGLLCEGKLGYLALLRNLCGMDEAGVDRALVREALVTNFPRLPVLPFQFIAAAKAAPMFESEIDAAMVATANKLPELGGRSAILIDISASMESKLSKRSSLEYWEAGAGIAMGLAAMCDAADTYVFGSDSREVPARTGMGLYAAVKAEVDKNHSWNDRGVGHGTNIGGAVERALRYHPDRVIVVSDMQSSTPAHLPEGVKGYMMDVSCYQHAVGYGRWTNINGFSNQVLRYLSEYEAL